MVWHESCTKNLEGVPPMKKFLLFISVCLLTGPVFAQQKPPTQLGNKPTPDSVATARVGEEVRHELAMMPYYSVFDWIEGQLKGTDTVVLRGQVTRPTTKSDAENRVKRIESVARVDSQIEVLPISPSDDAIRIAMFRALFKYDGPLFRYSTQARIPIHIIVNNGRVTLKGIVANDGDKQIA